MKPWIPLAAGLLAASTAVAEMAEVDQNGDGVASYEEIATVYPDVTEEAFDGMDANGDGSLDPDEMMAAQEAGLLPKAE